MSRINLKREDFDIGINLKDIQKYSKPNSIPILPLRNTILFPNHSIPLYIGRKHSLALLNEIIKGNKLVAVVSQKDASIENPTFNDVYKYGTLAILLKTVKMPDKFSSIFIQGVKRIKIHSFSKINSFYTGKIEIIEDAIVVKTGEEISQEMVGLLAKMGIEPMEVGLDLVAVYENGQIFTKDVLAIDEEEYANNFTQAQSWAFNLAVEAGIMTVETTELMIQKASKEVKALALEANILTDETKDEILAKAEAQGQAVGKELNLPAKEAVKEPEEPKVEEKTETPKEEVKTEDKPAEVKEEPKKEEKKEEPVKEEDKKDSEPSTKPDVTDEKVAGMVGAWKEKDKPKQTAQDIIKDADKA